jgi:hypothetical protein
LIVRYIAVFFAQRLSPIEFTNIFGNRGSLQDSQSEIREGEIEEDEDVEDDNYQSNSLLFFKFHLKFFYKEESEYYFETVSEHFVINLLRILTRIQVK